MNWNDEQILVVILLGLIAMAFTFGAAAGYAGARIQQLRRREWLAEQNFILEWQRDQALCLTNRAPQQDSRQRL